MDAARGAPAETPVSAKARVDTPATRKHDRVVQFEWNKLVDHMKRQARGLRTIDPFVYKGAAEKRELRRLGLVRRKDGRLADAAGAREEGASR